MTSQLVASEPGVMTTQPGQAKARQGRTRRAVSAAGILRLLLLFGFAVFCLVPLVWLLFAPTKTNAQLTSGNPLSFGSIQTAITAWQHLAGYNNGVMFAWMANSVLYSVGSDEVDDGGEIDLEKPLHGKDLGRPYLWLRLAQPN